MVETAPLLSAPVGTRNNFPAFLRRFWPLGMVAFGGPTAHVALLQQAFVESPDPPRVDNSTFVELFALTNALPGPGSTQLTTALGATFGGLWGAILTFFIWQIPGALAMTLAGLCFHSNLQSPNAIETVTAIADYAIGLIAAAFGMVALASVKITSKACGDSKLKMTVCLVSATVAMLIPPSWSSWVFVSLLVAGGLTVLAEHYYHEANGDSDLPTATAISADHAASEWESGIGATSGAVVLGFFAAVTLVLGFWRTESKDGRLLQSFWRIGWTVFGGGQVVIPMILNEVVESGWLPDAVFLSGFGLVGIAPGPMFNLAPFLGAAMLSWKGALYATCGLFVPGIALIIGILPFWERFRKWKLFRVVFLSGVNAAAAGLIIAGVWMLMKRALVGPLSFSLAVCAGAASHTYGFKTPWIILTCGAVGFVAVMVGLGGPYH